MLQRPRRDPLLTVAMVLFTLGLVALAVAFGLFASGHRGLPLWLSLSIVLLPVGLAIGLVRSQRRAPNRPEPSQATRDDTEDSGHPDDVPTEEPENAEARAEQDRAAGRTPDGARTDGS
jgi:type VI protein secretion system component VasK